MKKRALSLLLTLTMLLSLVPAFGIGAMAGQVGKPVRTETLVTYTLSDTNSAEGWAWDSTKKELTIEGLTINCSGTGIKLPGGSTLIVKGTNTINVSGAETTYGITAAGDLTVYTNDADAKLTVVADNTVENGDSYGIIAHSGVLTVKGGGYVDVTADTNALISTKDTKASKRNMVIGEGVKVTATLSSGSSGAAILTNKGTVKIQEAAAVTTNGGGYGIQGDAVDISTKGTVAVNNTSRKGIWAQNGNIIISKATLSINGGKYGLYAVADDSTVGSVQTTSSAKVTIENMSLIGVFASGTFSANNKSKVTVRGCTDRESKGITADTVVVDGATLDVSINNGVNTAVDKTGDHQYAIQAQSSLTIGTPTSINPSVTSRGGAIGVICSNGTVSISAGTVDASAGITAIWAKTGLNISGGTVKAVATDATETTAKAIYTSTGDIVVSDKANVTATGKDYGIRAKNGNITLGGYGVVAAGGEAAFSLEDGKELFASGMTVTGNTDKDGTSGTPVEISVASDTGKVTNFADAKYVLASKGITEEAELAELFQKGGYGVLASDITLSSLLTVNSGMKVTLNLNNCVLNGNALGSVITNKGTLYIVDNDTAATTRYFTDNGGDGCFEKLETSYATANKVEGKDYVKVIGGVITGGNTDKYGGAIYNIGTTSSPAALVLRGGNIVGNKASTGGGIYSDKASFTMEGGAVIGNLAKKDTYTYGGGLYLNGTSTLSGGEVSYNSSVCEAAGQRAYGGGIYISSAAKINTIDGMTICGNTAKATKACLLAYGGGIALMSGNTSTMNNCTVKNNKVLVDTVSGGENTVAVRGGGIYCGRSLTLSGTTVISDNTAENATAKNDEYTRHAFGGGICLSGDESSQSLLTIAKETVRISNNLAKSTYKAQGGGVYMSSNCKFTMTAGTITGNVTEAYKDDAVNEEEGGGLCVTYASSIFTVGGTAKITGNTGSDNTANNVYLRKDEDNEAVIAISTAAVPADTMSIGVTTAVVPAVNEPVVISSASTADYSKNFFSDNSHYCVIDTPSGHVLKLVTEPAFDDRFDGKVSFTGSEANYVKYDTYTAATVSGGYTFAGWYTGMDGSGTALGSGTPIPGTTYYAKWTKTIGSDTYTVWTQDDSMPASGGKYLLHKNIELETGYTIPANLWIALNGKRIHGAQMNDESNTLTIVIQSEADMNNAMEITTKKFKQNWEIASDITIERFVKVYNHKLSINGNGHTITGASGTSLEPDKTLQMFAIDSVEADSRNNISISNLKLVCSDRFKNVLAVQNKDESNNGIKLTLTDVTIDHTNCRADGAAILNFGSSIMVKGSFTLTTGESDCYAIGMNLAKNNAVLEFDDEATVSITDKRIEQKADRALIFFSSRSSDSSATVRGKYVTENLGPVGDTGYNPFVTVTFDSKGGSAVADAKTVRSCLVTKPADPTYSGYSFGGWYTDTGCTNAWNFNEDKVPDDYTLYAKWIQDSVEKAVVTGTVTDGSNPVDGAVVELRLGTEKVAAANTNASGVYTFDNVENGLYNIVVTKDGKTKTTVVHVNEASSFAVTPVVLPAKEVSSKVELKNTDTIAETAKANAASVVVGGVDAIAEAIAPSGTDKITIALTVEPKAAEPSNAQQTAIKSAASGKKVEFLDLTLTKQVNNEVPSDIGSTNSTLLTINVPFDTTGVNVSSITVYRYHGTTAETFTKITNEADKADGKFMVNDDSITIYAEKFSTYAIGYSLNSLISGGTGALSYAVNTNTATHGSVSVNKSTAAVGATVTLTVKADKGWTLETLTVKTAAGKEVTLTATKTGETYTFTMPASAVTITATFMEDNTMLNFFVDVKADDYFYDAVLWAATNGITSGVDATHFAPNAITTRSQMVTFLWRAAGCPEPTTTTCAFTDLKADEFYYKAVLWAVENGLTKGVSATEFAPDVTVDRAQSVTFLARYEGVKDDATGYTHSFSDVAAADYYNNAVAWAATNKVTEGTSATTFSPNDSCLRGQIVTFIYRNFVK